MSIDTEPVRIGIKAQQRQELGLVAPPIIVTRSVN